MAKSNTNFLKLKREYIFPIIEKKLFDLKEQKPLADIINVGIGDVSLPLAPSVADSIAAAVQEMSSEKGLRGYGPSEGYTFLRTTIKDTQYAHTSITWDEIFISEGINSDIANITEVFHKQSIAAIPDPTYPVYLDSNIIAGRDVVLMPCTEETRCLPQPPKDPVDIIYLCSPSNPTGVAMNAKELQAFIDFAKKHSAIILYDNAYSAFISSPDVPKSIYEIPHADEVAIEFRSFSKSAGFTGLRCGYTVIPKKITTLVGRKKTSLWSLWGKRISIKSNGVSYPIQKGAQSSLIDLGKKQTEEQIQTYMQSAQALRNGLEHLGFTCYGGIDAPYVWWKIPTPHSSWDFFDILLNQCQIVAIPGKGFGEHGEGFIRLSAFTKLSKVHQALERIQTLKL
jgi:LL-diaminopimelate aminotransferase